MLIVGINVRYSAKSGRCLLSKAGSTALRISASLLRQKVADQQGQLLTASLGPPLGSLELEAPMSFLRVFEAGP